MFGLGQIACVFCDHPVPKREAFRLRDRRDTAVCQSCRDRWEREGRKCGACQSVVYGPQDVGVLLDRYTFGHADCGALQLSR
jgi:hypothetical protein